jgi:putative ABC transport system permease protein
MFAYYLRLGANSLRRNPVLTALMVLTLAVGVAASMSTYTVLRAMSGDPIPHKSDRLLVLQIDNSPPVTEDNPQAPPSADVGINLPNLSSWVDVRALLEQAVGERRTGIYGISGVIEPEGEAEQPVLARGLAVSADFFSMFETPFRFGGGWSAEDEAREARVVVLSAKLAERLFGDADPTGHTLRMSDSEFRVAGVAEEWTPMPRYYWLSVGRAFSDSEEIWIPLRTAIAMERDPEGNVNCNGEGPGPGFAGLINSECVFMSYWVELADASDRAAFNDTLSGYVAQQKALGRLPHGENSRALDVMQWLTEQQVIGSDTRLQVLLAFAFLLVCMVNTVGLLLAKFTQHTGEIGVRRALGATRRQIFAQYLVQAGVVGIAGGAMGLLLTFGGLWVLAQQSTDVAAVAKLNPGMLLITLGTAIVAAVLAGLLPTWRACQVLPAAQLKTQ